MKILSVFNNYQQTSAYRKNSAKTDSAGRPSFQKLTLHEKSFETVFPNFWADKFAVRELTDTLSGLAQDDDVELIALEVVESKHPEAIGSWVCAKVKNFCNEDTKTDWTRFATETQDREPDGKAFQDAISVNHVVSFVTKLQYQLENFV